MRTLAFLLCLLAASPVLYCRTLLAADVPAAPSTQPSESTGDSEFAPVPPQVPTHAIWIGSAIIAAIFLFVAAAIIGPIVRYHLPQEIPPMHTHDEPPGASGHHGSTGANGSNSTAQ